MDLTIVLFVVSALLGVINVLMGISYKNLKEQIQVNTNRLNSHSDEMKNMKDSVNSMKLNYVQRFGDLKETMHQVEKNILSNMDQKLDRILDNVVTKDKCQQFRDVS